MANEKRLIDANALSDLLDVEYKRKMKLVRKGEAHLDTLAEGIMSMSVLLGTIPTVDAAAGRAEGDRRGGRMISAPTRGMDN